MNAGGGTGEKEWGGAAPLRIRLLEELEELEAAEALVREIWGGQSPSGLPVNVGLMRALAHSGSYVAGAFDAQGELQGALVAFLGSGHGALHLHSHVLGVAPGQQARGAGFALKRHQREWALAAGIDVVRWTFDPLVRRNAHFNLAKLGAGVEAYLVNFYGNMDDAQNRADESDRILAHWDLRSPAVAQAAAGRPEPAATAAELASAARGLAIGPNGGPELQSHGDAACVLLAVPEDIVQVRLEQTGLARPWRTALRSAFTGLLDAGYICTGFTRAGDYVLRRKAE